MDVGGMGIGKSNAVKRFIMTYMYHTFHFCQLENHEQHYFSNILVWKRHPKLFQFKKGIIVALFVAFTDLLSLNIMMRSIAFRA